MLKTAKTLAAAGTVALAAIVGPAPAEARNGGAIAAGVSGGTCHHRRRYGGTAVRAAARYAGTFGVAAAEAFAPPHSL